jgi:hypothetical protein
VLVAFSGVFLKVIGDEWLIIRQIGAEGGGLKGAPGRKAIGAFGFGAFHLTDVVFVFGAQPLQSAGLRGFAFPDFIQPGEGA